MTTNITELAQESARESGSILIIVAARMARREFFTLLHALCESGKRVVSTRALCDAVERAEEHMVSQVQKIVDGHDRLTKKLKDAESRNAELVEALEKAQHTITEMDNRIRKQNRHVCELFDDNIALRQRIVGIEESNAQVIQSRDHYKRMSEEGLKQLAESRTVTVKLPYLPDDCDRTEAHFKYQAALTAAGIKWEAE